MYLAHFKLRGKPFQLNTDPRFLWLGRQHQEALVTLRYGIQENKGLLLLTGDIGTGKTMLISALADRLVDDNVVVAKLPDPGFDRNDFFFLVSHNFGIHHQVQDKETFTEAFDHFLERTSEKRQKALLIVDEAQIMSTKILEEVRLLSNMECRSTKLLNIILVGQNAFNQLLYKAENRAIRERITISYNLQPLTEAETEAYIAHRLKIAGTEAKIFTDDAVREIHAFSNGSPRQISIICDLALVLGFGKNATEIDSRMIAACKERMCIPNVSGAPLPDEYLPARADSPSKTITLGNSLPAGDGPTLHPSKSQTLPIPAVPPKRSSRIRFHILLVLLIFVPGSYLLYLDLNLGQSPEKLSAPKTNRAPAGQPARKTTAPLAPLPQPPPSLSSGAVKTPPSEKVSEKPAAKNIPSDVVVWRPTPEAIQTQKRALTQDAGPPLADKKTVIAPPEKSVSLKELPTDGIVVWKPTPEAMQTQKRALTQGAGQPLADKKTEVAPLGNSANPIVAEHPLEKTLNPMKSPIAPALAPAPLQTEQMSKVNRPASKRKSARPKKAPEVLRPPSSETPDPADIVKWLLQEKRKGGNRPNP
ncbi:MAG: AAA family ATPase [Desulfobacterales bacterium]